MNANVHQSSEREAGERPRAARDEAHDELKLAEEEVGGGRHVGRVHEVVVRVAEL